MSPSRSEPAVLNINRKEITMTYTKPALILAAMAIPTVALAELAPGTALGTEQAEIIAELEAQGYVVQEIEVEDGMFEVEATLDGALYEIEVDLSTGEVAEIELEDGDDDDDDDA